MKLFSFEDEMTQDIETAEGGDTVEAAVNEAVVEAEQEHPDEEIVAVDNAIEAGDDLEHVEEFVEKQEEQGGMDEDTAEAVKIAVEAIARRVGYNPKNIYQLYATESFASSSSRKVNTQLAMEGIKDFLKNLWEKIKAFAMKIWDKIKEFWDKHFSTVGRLVKKLEALGEKIAESSGNRKDTGGKDIKAPSDIARAFKTSGTLSISDVREYMTDVKGFVEGIKAQSTTGINTVLSKVDEQIKEITDKYEKVGTDSYGKSKEEIREAFSKIDEEFKSGEISKALNVNAVKYVFGDNASFTGGEEVVIPKVVGGKKLVVEADETRITLTLQSIDESSDASLDMVIASKKDLADLNRDMTKMLNTYLYLKDNVNKVNDTVNKFIKNADKKIKEVSTAFATFEVKAAKGKKAESVVEGNIQAAMEKSLSKQLHTFSRISNFYANVFRMAKTIVISTVQAGVRYITFTLKQYKSAE
jgi:molybdopterin converting factor small subunit